MKSETATPLAKEGSQPTCYLFEVRVIHPRQTVFQIVTKLEDQLPEFQIRSFVIKGGRRIPKTTDGQTRDRILDLKELDGNTVDFLHLSVLAHNQGPTGHTGRITSESEN